MNETETEYLASLESKFRILEGIHRKSMIEYWNMKDTLTRAQMESTRLLEENRELRRQLHVRGIFQTDMP